MTSAVPPKLRLIDSPAFFMGVIGAATLVGVAAVVFFFNPVTTRFYPICRFHQLTGLNCPGCGATRAFYALLHGHLQAAFKDNAFFVITLAGVAGRAGWLAWKNWRGQSIGAFVPAKWLWPFLVAGLVFAVLRNLPAFSFLSP